MNPGGTIFNTLVRVCLALAIASVSWIGPAMATDALNARAPVVIELFTSQGCSSCPPADKIMAETLANRDDVIAFSLPIDYWDNYGWRDTFASPDHTARQRAYADRLPNRRVYTPQVVINGRIDVIGTRETEILNALTSEKATSRSTVPIDVSLQTSNLLIKIGEAPESLGDINADIWILPYHSRIQSVEVEAGENAGRTLNYANVVVGMTRLGSYSGKPVTIEYGMPDSEIGSPDACAVLVQLRDAGPIIGAHRVDMEDAS